MKHIKTIAAVAGLACAAVSSQAAITLNGSSVTSQIVFNGNSTFDFVSSGPIPILITSVSGGLGDSAGDIASIGGVFTIGAQIGATGKYVVTGAGTLTITDPSANSLTAALVWDTISSGPGTSGNINVDGQINLSGISYSGTQSDLLALKAGTLGIETVSFVFTSTKSIPQLQTTLTKDAYNTAITSAAVPEPTTVVAGALLLLPLGLSAVRIIRKDKSNATA